MACDDELMREVERRCLRWGRTDGTPVSRAALVTEARSWIGTPFMHQAHLKGVGVDCGGLVRGASMALGLIPSTYLEEVPQELRAYSRKAISDLGKRLCDFYWRPIALGEIRPADVLLFHWRNGPPQHSAIVGDLRGGLSIIHALGPRRPNRVVEHGLDALWRSRVVAAYSLPGVEA